ncbi:MAG TPA: type II secretion system F family protein [Nocardioidaceae bacterium]|nr:type II secretion system F family protein [Nocardioidaceae bacterium]
MILQLFAGALSGVGLLLLVYIFVRPRAGVGATLARIDSGRRSQYSATASAASPGADGRLDHMKLSIGERIEAEATARGWSFVRTRSDLAVMNRTFAAHMGTKVLFALFGLIWFPLILVLTGIGGTAAPALVGLVAAAIFFFLPDMQLHREAEKRRRDFRHVMGSFLDLVAMNLAGGRGLPEALMAASSIGEHWAMIRIRQALSNARIVGITPWEGIAQLGRDLGVEELRDLASALALAGDEGAKIRASLMARAESLRRKELADVEGTAGESSQSMLLAQILIALAFLIFLVYPALARLQ